MGIPALVTPLVEAEPEADAPGTPWKITVPPTGITDFVALIVILTGVKVLF